MSLLPEKQPPTRGDFTIEERDGKIYVRYMFRRIDEGDDVERVSFVLVSKQNLDDSVDAHRRDAVLRVMRSLNEEFKRLNSGTGTMPG